MKQPDARQFLTTRSRIIAAMVVAAAFFALEVRALLSVQPKAPWLISPSFLLQGWLLVAVNVFLYCFICWIYFWIIRSTSGRERFFGVAWSLSSFLWPIKMLWPQWSVATREIGALGTAAALLTAFALLLHPSEWVNTAEHN